MGRSVMLGAMLALVVCSSIFAHEIVEELGEGLTGEPNTQPAPRKAMATNGGDDTHGAPPAEATGNFKTDLNLPGPRHGLPGYKESHNWETGVDYFSPIIFDPLWYAAKYGMTQNTTQELKNDWIQNGMKGQSPSCRQGTAMFSINKYANNHPQAAVVKAQNGTNVKADCKQMTDHYLRVGMYEGWSGDVGFNINQGGASDEETSAEIDLKPGNVDLTGNVDGSKATLRPELSYTYTLWLKALGLQTSDSNILTFGVDDMNKQPTMALNMQAGSTNLEYKVAQSDFPDWSCVAVAGEMTDSKPGYLALSKDYFVALVTQKFHASASKIILYVDGVKACEKDNTAGTSIEPDQNAQLYISAPGQKEAKAKVKMVKFFPGQVFTADEVKARMTAESRDIKALEGEGVDELRE